jgi:hypothetical protein
MTVALRSRKPLVVSAAVLRQAGFKAGQELEVRVSGGAITILPKAASADDEYTPAQRRVIDAGLAKGEADIKAGRVHGPFTAKETSAFIEQRAKERAGRKSTRPRR